MTRFAAGSLVMIGCFWALALLGCGGRDEAAGDEAAGDDQGDVTACNGAWDIWCACADVSCSGRPESCIGPDLEWAQCIDTAADACTANCRPDPEAASGGVTGVWCGRDVTLPEECVGDEAEYLELRQEGGRVTGVICEAFQKDCAAIEDGRLAGSQLTFGFDPQDVGGRATLTLSGDVLDGDLYAGKCACHLPYTFHRL